LLKGNCDGVMAAGIDAPLGSHEWVISGHSWGIA
jgi:hypothetical protein